MPPTLTASDRVFAALASRTGLTPPDVLATVVAAVPGDGSRTLAGLLEERGLLGAADRAALEGVVAASLRAHDGDCFKTLLGLAWSAPPADDATALLGGTEPPDLGFTFGEGAWGTDRFRGLRFHARGGLGEVYIAHDGELNREVALKRIQARHADHPDHRARFIVEAEVTGALEHPGIVPIYSLGAGPDGRPYYAMRFIRGESLEEAIVAFHRGQGQSAQRALDLRRLLGRLVDACEAMAYAHSRGVVHRDLKPSNIMLGEFGETLVVDWGLARDLGRGEASRDEPSLALFARSGSTPTQAGSVVGTPAFMSPEQARGEVDGVGPAADIYSLGATLYALLTGRPAFNGAAPLVLLEQVRAGAIPAPSSVRVGVPPALGAICLRAMAARPEDRYPSALALADELERWLADEPISAYREPWPTRLARWRRRHHALVTSAAAVLVATVLTLAVGTLAINAERAVAVTERDHARDERARAQAEFRRARRAVDDSFTRVSQELLLNVPGLQPLRRDLLQAARGYYEEFLRDRGDDSSLREELAQTQSRLGAVAESLGDHDDALRADEAAVVLWEALVRERADPPRRLALARALDRLGNASMHRTGGLPRAWEAIGRAITLLEPLTEDGPDRLQVLSYLAGCYANLGAVNHLAGRAGEAIPQYRRGAAIRASLVRDHPGASDLRYAYAMLLVDMARIYCQAGPASEVIPTGERAVDLFEGLHRERPEAAHYSFQLALALADLGRVQVEPGPGSSRDHLRRAEELLAPLVQQNPRVTEYRTNLAALGNALAVRELRGGQRDLAARHVATARDLFGVLAREQPEQADYRESLSQSWNITGRLAAAEDRRADARAGFDRAAALVAELPDQIATHRYNFACNLALGLPFLPADLARPTPEERAHGAAQAARAVAALDLAVAAGLTNIDVYLHDDDLDPLRGRDDFRALIGRLLDREFPADPFAR